MVGPENRATELSDAYGGPGESVDRGVRCIWWARKIGRPKCQVQVVGPKNRSTKVSGAGGGPGNRSTKVSGAGGGSGKSCGRAVRCMWWAREIVRPSCSVQLVGRGGRVINTLTAPGGLPASPDCALRRATWAVAGVRKSRGSNLWVVALSNERARRVM